MSPSLEKSPAAAIRKARGAFPSLAAPCCPGLTLHCPGMHGRYELSEICVKVQHVKIVSVCMIKKRINFLLLISKLSKLISKLYFLT